MILNKKIIFIYYINLYYEILKKNKIFDLKHYNILVRMIVTREPLI